MKIKNTKRFIIKKTKSTMLVALKKSPSFIRSRFLKPGVVVLAEKRIAHLAKLGPFDNVTAGKAACRFFNQRKSCLSLPLKEFLTSLFNVLGGHSGLYNNNLQELTQVAESLGSEWLEPGQWLDLYRLCCNQGLYAVAFPLRENALKETIKKGKEDALSSNPREYLAACLELGVLSISEIDSLLQDKRLPEKNKKIFRSYVSAMERVGERNLSGFIDPGYEKYIKHCSVAFSGPSESTTSAAHLIDGYERVIRLNYSESGKGCDDTRKGRKVSVAYFNGEQTESLVNERNGVLPEELDYACFKSDIWVDKIQSLNPSVHCRSIAKFDQILFCGTLNMGPLAVLDCLVHEPKSLHIYHMDLMLTVRRYGGYYPDSYSRDTNGSLIKAFTRGSPTHDPVSQYRVFKNLWDRGVVSGDDRFNLVMGLGTEEYMRQLQEIYGCHKWS